MVGRTLGHYRVVEKLGEGGMGEVYLAEDAKLERKVALKVLPAKVASDPDRLARFEREAKAVAALNHPNIVTVFSVEEDQGIHYLTMELVEGESLDKVTPSEGLPLEQFFELAIPLADALSEAHEQGVVHRDLKPANIMVDRKGRPKILDFGLAKLRQPETAEGLSELPTEVMTEEGKVLGTYPYMSPEQVEGREVDHRSDLFSFGSVLYEMATGERPFQGESSASVMSAILRDSPPDVDIHREELPHHLARILGRCLGKDPDDRYQRAKDLRNDLEELRQEVGAGEVVPRRPAAVRGTKRTWSRVGVAGALLLLAAFVVIFVTKPWEEEAQLEPDSGPRITSLAVLPLENLSGDPEQDYFADGMTDGLITDLSRISALRVISRQSVMRYKNSDMPLPEIAEELNVDALVEGSVLSAGDRIRITAQLVQASPETHLWARTYERDAQDVLSLLSEVTKAIAGEIQVVVTPEEQLRLADTREVDPDALKAYLKGVHLFSMLTGDEVRKSEKYFREAIEIDPTFAAAWAGLAAYYQGLEFWVLPVNANEIRLAVAAEGDGALKKALELDESLGYAHTLKAMIEFLRNWDWEKAESEFRRAVELSPSDSAAHAWLGYFLASMGRCPEGVLEAELAEGLDPHSQLVLRVKGDVLYYCHEFEQALDQYGKALELFPGNAHLVGQMAFNLIALGRGDEAVDLWRQFRTWVGNEELAKEFEGKSLEEVNRIYARSAGDPSSPMYSPFVVAKVYAENGEAEKVFEWLETAYEARSEPGGTAGYMMVSLGVDPDFLYLHSDPRFQDLLQRMNLAD